jgi:hypothetical protein
VEEPDYHKQNDRSAFWRRSDSRQGEDTVYVLELSNLCFLLVCPILFDSNNHSFRDDRGYTPLLCADPALPASRLSDFLLLWQLLLRVFFATSVDLKYPLLIFTSPLVLTFCSSVALMVF